MLISPTAFLPHIRGLRLDHVDVAKQRITLVVTAVGVSAPCPLCQQHSTTVHSTYTRTVADQPWCGRVVSLRVQTRRFACRVVACERKIFCERLPAVVAVYARRTHGLRSALERIAAAVTSKVGARLATAQGMPTSWMTLLRVLRRLRAPVAATPRVLGVDDWSWRKGRTYGTVLVDLERHCPVDILPDRTAATFATWLRAHAGVEIISRARAGAYADGARQGAPHALQVADHFHLTKNAGESLDRVLTRYHAALRQAAHAPLPSPPQAAPPVAPTETVVPVVPRPQREQAERQARRQARYAEVMALHEQGYGQRAIARALGVARHTVQRFTQADAFPARKQRAPRPTILTPYEPYLRERWDAGEQNAATLYGELRTRGFTGASSLVRQRVAKWRDGPAPPGRPGARRARHTRPLAPPPARTFSPRQTLWLLLGDPADLDAEEDAYRARLRVLCPTIAHAQDLIHGFLRLLRERDQAALDPWLDAAAASQIPEMCSFAAGLRRDYAAVEAALSTEWNNGQVEGQVNRLKLLKRQGYGRAGFALLRQRVLHRG